MEKEPQGTIYIHKGKYISSFDEFDQVGTQSFDLDDENSYIVVRNVFLSIPIPCHRAPSTAWS